jgi:hypothetical protein
MAEKIEDGINYIVQMDLLDREPLLLEYEGKLIHHVVPA